MSTLLPVFPGHVGENWYHLKFRRKRVIPLITCIPKILPVTQDRFSWKCFGFEFILQNDRGLIIKYVQILSLGRRLIIFKTTTGSFEKNDALMTTGIRWSEEWKETLEGNSQNLDDE